MSWTKISEDLYNNDTALTSIEKIDGIWYVIDNSRQQRSIPFTDIFNNPVFPVDFSNVDMIVKSLVSNGSISGDSLDITNNAKAKHFRQELSGDPSTPGFSAQGDPNTGFYHISDGVFGYSSNGIKKSEFNELGLLNEPIAADYRNTIQIVNAFSPGQNLGFGNLTALKSNQGYNNTNTTNYRVVLQGYITPKKSNSLILINGTCQLASGTSTLTTQFLYLVRHTASQGNIGDFTLSSFLGTEIARYGNIRSTISGQADDAQNAIHCFSSGHNEGTTYWFTLFAKNSSGTNGNINATNVFSEMSLSEII